MNWDIFIGQNSPYIVLLIGDEITLKSNEKCCIFMLLLPCNVARKNIT